MNDSYRNKEKEAIEAAWAGDWQAAIKVNLELLKENPRSVSTLNRLGRAFWQNNNLSTAFATYRKVLRIERYNPIATKALKQLKTLKETGVCLKIKSKNQNLARCFLKEPGKTKTVHLLNVARAPLLCQLNSAECLKMLPKSHGVVIARENGDYLGSLPDDLAHHLLTLLKKGNRYEVWVKTVEPQTLEVFIREIFRSKRLKNQPSFVRPNG
jgi:tetratricopeptide (TPR) repeat protein